MLPPVVSPCSLIVREVPRFPHKCHLCRTRRCTRCCDAQGAGAVVFRINAMSATRRGAALIVRSVPGLFTHKCHNLSARRRTRCCDAQCAGAIVSRINAIYGRQ